MEEDDHKTVIRPLQDEGGPTSLTRRISFPVCQGEFATARAQPHKDKSFSGRATWQEYAVDLSGDYLPIQQIASNCDQI